MWLLDHPDTELVWTPAPKVGAVVSGSFLDCFDLTATLDERGDIRPRIGFQVGKDKDQEPPASEASASRIAIGNDPMGERYLVPTIVSDVYVNTRFSPHQWRVSATPARKVSQQRYPEVRGDPFMACPLAHHVPVAEATHRNLPLWDVKEAIEKFGPLRSVLGAIPTVYANHEVRQ